MEGKMKKLFFASIFLALALAIPGTTIARVDIHVGIALPPPLVFPTPPNVVVIPDTNYVYAAPDIDEDLFFWNGWWWRPWQGGWYRSRYYDRGWVYYNAVPGFYYDVDPYWRKYYRNRHWYVHEWRHERIPNQQLQRNWRSWENNRYWDRQRNWNLQRYEPLSPP